MRSFIIRNCGDFGQMNFCKNQGGRGVCILVLVRKFAKGFGGPDQASLHVCISSYN